MSTHAAFISWIRKNVEYYAPFLGLQLQKIEIEHDSDINFLAITCTYPYLEPTIKFSDKAFEVWKKGKLHKDRILHELLHIITDPLYVKATKRYVTDDEIVHERERLTDTLTVIIRNLITNKQEKHNHD